MTEIDEVMRRVHALGADHSLDGWPAVQMRDLVLMHHEIRDLRAQLRTQKKGVLAVIKASVELVCSPAWAGVSDEDVALEQALRDAGFVTPNAKVTGSPALSASPRGLPGWFLEFDERSSDEQRPLATP